MRKVLALLIFFLTQVLSLRAALTVNTGVVVNANTCDQVAWADSTGRTRTASIVQLNGAPAGKVGGFITQFVYNPGAGNVTCNESGYGVDGNLSGLGQMVNHGGTGNGWVSSNVDGIKAGASTQVIFQGANHVIYQVDMDENGDNGDATKGTWHDRWNYMFSTGHDYFVESISYDFSSHIAGYWGYAGVSGQTAHDSRSPYCSFNWSGTGAANTLTESIDGIEWAARDSTTNSYIFKTVGSSPFSSGYTYNTAASNIPYTLQWKNAPDREIGYVSTFDLSQFAAGEGFTSQCFIGSTSTAMPANWGVNYQSNGFQGWMGDKMTWGVPYGAAGGTTGATTFPDWTYARNWTGYPTMGYTLLIQMGSHSGDGVHSQVAEQAAIHALPSTALTAAIGTVVTTGKMNLQDPSSSFSFKPQGYNHMYHAWELVCAGNAADTTLALGAASLKNPTFIFDSFNLASLCQLTLNGAVQVEGADIYTSIDTVNKKLYITFNKVFTGNEHIVVAATCTTPTFTATATACGACTATATPTQVPTVSAGSKQYCLTVNYAAIPALVNYRKLTLKVDVGTCSSVSVTEDGVPIPAPAVYNAGTGIATFTVTGTNIIVTANGWTAGGTGAATKATLYADKHWAHSFTLDDGIQLQYDNAKPVFDAKGWRGGIALNASGIVGGNTWNMTWAETQTLRAAGWDVFNHSYTHPTITCANFTSEFDQNQTQFLLKFPGYHVSHVVYPFENSTATSCAGWPPAYLISGEGGGGSYNFVDTALPSIYTIQRATFYGTNIAAMQTLPATAAGNARPTWLITITHSVVPAGNAPPDAYSTNVATLSAYLDYLNNNFGTAGNNSMWFAPAGEVSDYLMTRDNAVVSSFTCGTPTPTPTVCGACTSTSTVTPSPSNTVTLTSTPVPACSGGLVDDLEGGSTQNKYGGYWYTYAGTSTINSPFAAFAPGHTSLYCARANGNCVLASQPSLGTGLVAAGSDLSSHSGLSFWFKGDGNNYRVQLHSVVEGSNYNDYKYDFSPPVGWSLVNVPWASFVFPGWGPAYAFDNKQLTGISWVPMSAGAFDFSVDDILFTCSAVTPSPTPTLTSTRTATSTFSNTPTATATPSVGSSSTFTGTTTGSPSPTLTFTGTPSASSSSTPSATPSSTASATPTGSFTATASPSVTATFTDVPPGSTLTNTPTISATRTSTLTATGTNSASPTYSPTATPSITVSPTATPSITITVSGTSSATASPSITATFTAVPTGSTATKTNTVIPSGTSSPTSYASPVTTVTPSVTGTGTSTFTSTATSTVTGTSTNFSTRTATLTVTPSSSSTGTAIGTATFSSTMTPTTVSTSLASTPTSTAAVTTGPVEILDLEASPNPNPSRWAIKMAGQADDVEIRVYSVGASCVALLHSGPVQAGWSQVQFPSDWLRNNPNGLFYAKAVAHQGVKVSLPSKTAKVLVLH